MSGLQGWGPGWEVPVGWACPLGVRPHSGACRRSCLKRAQAGVQGFVA